MADVKRRMANKFLDNLPLILQGYMIKSVNYTFAFNEGYSLRLQSSHTIDYFLIQYWNLNTSLLFCQNLSVR